MVIARRRAAERLADLEPATWGLNAQALDLEANAGLVSSGAAGEALRIRRHDVFDRFLARGSLAQGAHDAVRRLQDDIAILHRAMAGGGGFAPRVDRQPDPQHFTDARRRAGLRIQAVLDHTGASSARLLSALCEPDIVLGRTADWRAVVARQTAERMAEAQGAVLRVACENLAGAYAIIDRQRRAGAGWAGQET